MLSSINQSISFTQKWCLKPNFETLSTWVKQHREKRLSRFTRTTRQTKQTEHLWRNDVEEVPRQSVLLRKDVVLVRLEGDAEHVDDEGTGGQVQGDAVLSHKRLQLRALLLQELQCHLCACQWKREGKKHHIAEVKKRCVCVSLFTITEMISLLSGRNLVSPCLKCF